MRLIVSDLHYISPTIFVYYTSIKEAIEREKQIKGGSRAAKVALIEGMNPGWEDLYDLL